jgi:hypothetical protein
LESEEISPTTLNDLFSQEVEDYTDEDIMKLIKVMRSRRGLWERDEASKTGQGRRATKRSSGTPEALKNLSLDDIMEDD